MALERPTYTQPLLLKRTLRVRQATTSRRVVMVCVDGVDVSLTGASISADLGGSSKYSSEILED